MTLTSESLDELTPTQRRQAEDLIDGLATTIYLNAGNSQPFEKPAAPTTTNKQER